MSRITNQSDLFPERETESTQSRPDACGKKDSCGNLRRFRRSSKWGIPYRDGYAGMCVCDHSGRPKPNGVYPARQTPGPSPAYLWLCAECRANLTPKQELDVAQRLGVRAVTQAWFARGTARKSPTRWRCLAPPHTGSAEAVKKRFDQSKSSRHT